MIDVTIMQVERFILDAKEAKNLSTLVNNKMVYIVLINNFEAVDEMDVMVDTKLIIMHDVIFRLAGESEIVNV